MPFYSVERNPIGIALSLLSAITRSCKMLSVISYVKQMISHYLHVNAG